MPPAKKQTITLGGVPIETGKVAEKRLALLLWGDAGIGKTTYACTAPGKKLLVNVDPDGYAAVSERSDVVIADVSSLSLTEFMKQALTENPFGLDKFLAENDDIDSVIIDSGTAIFERCLQHAVYENRGASTKSNFRPTMEEPGLTAYGARTAKMTQILSGILRCTGKHHVHCIITAHEGAAKNDDKGNLLQIGTSLSEGCVNKTTWRLSEIWYMSEHNNQKAIAVRPTRLRSPMKSRMFKTGLKKEFKLNYNADKPDKGQKDTLDSFFNEWKKRNDKLELP